MDEASVAHDQSSVGAGIPRQIKRFEIGCVGKKLNSVVVCPFGKGKIDTCEVGLAENSFQLFAFNLAVPGG